jgi:signal transduction histidine kinase
MGSSSESDESEDDESAPKEDLKNIIKIIEEELNQQRTWVSQLQKANLALQTCK